MKAIIVAIVTAILLPVPAIAQNKTITLSAPDALIETGFLKHLLVRFSLKTGVKILLSNGNNGEDSDAHFGTDGVAVFEGNGTRWHLSNTDGPLMDKLATWLLSDVGVRTIETFELDGKPMFTAAIVERADPQESVFVGDAANGERLSLALCGRCHVINETNRMKSIGSTPSFGLLRSFNNWQDRFKAFYRLRPHPAFTQVTGVSEPFENTLPSPIVPLEMSLDDLDAIVAYIAGIEPADLGAPIQSQ